MFLTNNSLATSHSTYLHLVARVKKKELRFLRGDRKNREKERGRKVFLLIPKRPVLNPVNVHTHTHVYVRARE